MNAEENPRWITVAEATQRFGTGKFIDLGLVSLRDATINGRNSILVPYLDGRLISGIRFIPSTTVIDNDPFNLSFMTPNTGGQNNGCQQGSIQSGGSSTDMLGVVTTTSRGARGEDGDQAQIIDCGPLVAAMSGGFPQSDFEPKGEWQADTAYALFDSIVEGENVFIVQTNGVSGSTKPVFDTNVGNTTSDNSVLWDCFSILPNGQAHVVAEVMEGVSIMPPYPATMEFESQPTETEAGATIAAFTIVVKDQNGDPYTFMAPDIYIAILGTGTLSGTTPKGAEEGEAPYSGTGSVIFDDLAIAEAGTGYVLKAVLCNSVVTTPILSDPFDVTAP